MSYKVIVLIFSLLCVLPAQAQDPAITAFKQLTHSITEFGTKLKKCRLIRNENKILAEDIARLKSMPEHALQALPYLNQLATNRCTQPERGQLAEIILNIESLELAQSKPNYAAIYQAMNAIREIEFDISHLNPSKEFFNLTQQEQDLLLEIESLNKPFDVLDVFERTSH
ncbi:hypothetical protein [Psychromonas aquimarina]|uniref:hypothetical protein n=1 Tax=Psychromonas aquimarina TaxID=444919 RepID=UPI00048F8D93|nr:hypothetical protein [Psychromonas aquimarina]